MPEQDNYRTAPPLFVSSQ